MTANIYLTLANPDRIAIMDYLAKATGATSNRELSTVIDRSEGWTRKHLVMLNDAGLIVRTHGPGAADAVRNTLADDIVWPVGLSVEHCKVLAITGRPDVMDYLAQAGRSTVSDIVKAVGISQSQASKHLKAMVGVGLVHREHRDRNSFWHSIADGVVWPVKVRSTTQRSN
jgi:DNA-binding MarR family transcriptional regulator